MLDHTRRHFISLVGGVATTWPVAAGAQQPAIPVIGFVRSGTPASVPRERLNAFRQGLREAGFVEGRDCAIEYSWADNQLDRLPALVADLLRRPVAVIVTNTPGAVVAKAATTMVPIVFTTGGDPVGAGLVASLNRPGGNVTGCQFHDGGTWGKQLGLLHELRPAAARIAVLVDPKFPTTERFVAEVRAAASAIGQQIEVLNVNSDREIETAFTALVQRGAGALLVGTGAFMETNRELIVALAARRALPASYVLREYVSAGGLMSYGAKITDTYRQAGIYAARILKGEKPGDLPVMLPTKFEFAINLKTAKTLGLEVPPTLLARADEVIE
jgi:putative tryptophan/tyrosine transport system substrate-binding protein